MNVTSYMKAVDPGILAVFQLGNVKDGLESVHKHEAHQDVKPCPDCRGILEQLDEEDFPKKLHDRILE